MSTSARPSRRKWVLALRIALVACVVLLLGTGLYLALRLTRDEPVDYADDAAHFKYGSTGGERLTGIPYWLWVALPEVFPEYLPDKTPGRGYTSFGMVYEAGRTRAMTCRPACRGAT